MAIQPKTKIGRYQILELIGRGGMAEVYKARDSRLDTTVAIKFIRSDQFPPSILLGVVKRFRNEAKRMAQLSHSNIAKVTDYGRYEGIPFLVMEYLPGGTLKKYLGKPMPYQKAAQLLLPVAQALAYAHSKGVIHRDVKPTNILLSETGQLMLSDFGVAKMMDTEGAQGLTATGAAIGTPEYMAPEQAVGKKIDHRVDIYSLGVIFYELVTGRRPYSAETPMEIVIKQSRDPLPPPSQFVKGLPAKVEQVIEKALAKDPGGRFTDMSAFTQALEKMAASAKPSPRKRTAPTSKKSSAVPREKKAQEQQAQRTAKVKPLNTKWLIGILAVAMVGLVIYIGTTGLGKNKVAPAAEEDPTPESNLGIGSSIISEIDGMRMMYVPEGEFLMGSEDGASDEDPIHTVYLDAYWTDQTEVTNAQYSACVQSGACGQPSSTKYFDDSNYGDHPVAHVDWGDAQDYCSWAGRRLPSEAEWEKAARGDDGRTYPWGDTFDSSLANLDDETVMDDYRIDCSSSGCDGYDRTAPVGSFPGGASPYEAFDMVGNVWEWVQDWYNEDYYEHSPDKNPINNNGEWRVLRGGSWFNSERYARSVSRYNSNPASPYYNFGFRCATSP